MVFALWEIVARAGVFPPKLFPSLVTVAEAFVNLTIRGILPHHVLDTVLRLLAGFFLAAVVGVALGILMGRSRRVEDIALPLVSIGAPIPGLAYAPLFLLWFGLGNKSAVLLVAFVSAFPIIFNTWTGVKAVKEIWVRSAQAMGADDRRLFVKVIVPGALPYILTGLRLGLAQAWRILVGIEMLAAVPWGLGWMIFGAREFLNTDVMLAGVVVIGVHRPRAGEARVPEARGIHRDALGDDDVSHLRPHPLDLARAPSPSWRRRLLYEAVARTGYFPPALMPTLPKVWNALVGSLLDGSMIAHAAGDALSRAGRAWPSRSRSACRSAS